MCLTTETTISNKTFAATIEAPVGILQTNDNNIPKMKQITDIAADDITRDLKLLAIFFAMNAGNIIKLEISKVPIILIPTTTVRAVKNDIKKW